MKRYEMYAANNCDEACDCTSRAVESENGAWCKASDVAELEKQLTDEQENHQGARECLDMVKECLENLGTDMSAVPPMSYNDAIRSTIARMIRRRSGEL